jgi:hypothetical protein
VTIWTRGQELPRWLAERGLRTDAKLIQELSRDGQQACDMKAQLVKQRWQAAVNPSAIRAAEGLPAGVAVLTSGRTSVPELETTDVDRRHPGRFRAVVWPRVLARGVLLGTVYGYAGQDSAAQAKNADLLELVAPELAAYRLLRILGGD